MLELRESLQRCGLSAHGQFKKFEELKPSDLPCIAHLEQPNHYVTLLPRKKPGQSKQFFVAIDGQKSRHEIKTDELRIT